MAFPTAGILDDFTGSTENPIAGGWAGPVISGETQLAQAAGVLSGGAGNSYWATSFGPDSEVYATFVTLPGDTFTISLYARLRTPGTAGVDCYRLQYIFNAGSTDVLRIRRMDNGVSTTLGADISQDFSVGDGIGLEVIGTTIAAYRRASGVWTQLGTRTDATYSAAGYIGVELGDGTVTLSNFGGGTVTGGAAGGGASQMLLMGVG